MTEIKGIHWDDSPIDSEPEREPDELERKLDEHMAHCAKCAFPQPCAVALAIAGIK